MGDRKCGVFTGYIKTDYGAEVDRKKLVKGVSKGDWAVVVQPSRVYLFIEEDGVALEQ
jgi:hypothetical protein